MQDRGRFSDRAPAGTLASLRSGTRTTVLSLNVASSQERSKLMALGVLPGADIRLLQRFPTFVVGVGYTQLALDRETARLIQVA